MACAQKSALDMGAFLATETGICKQHSALGLVMLHYCFPYQGLEIESFDKLSHSLSLPFVDPKTNKTLGRGSTGARKIRVAYSGVKRKYFQEQACAFCGTIGLYRESPNHLR
ncbi:hypothetical protein ACFQI7_07480 [Paenibacillus allorhizosphaerae]|uniref:hypothetical protein n=1 Tax=Paenibacillus allorhizosphaerae TaxID=2849866 RepID=UPI001C407CA6|nr:hypothetical protein [Paenibacillus allorhizosphaerae]